MQFKPGLYYIKNIFTFLYTGILVSCKLLCRSFLCYRCIKKYNPSGKSINSKRVRNYAFMVTGIVGYAIEQIIERKFSNDELENLCLAGAISPIYDSFFDDQEIDELQLLQLTFTPILVNIDNPMLKFYQYTLISLQQNIYNPVLFHDACYSVFKAQVNSRKQLNNPDLQSIAEISDEKGGASFIFYASTINNKSNIWQNKMIYDFGAYVQLLDDIFDVAGDIEKRVSTRVTNQLNFIENIQELLNRYLIDNIDRIEQSALSLYHKKKLINLYSFLALIGFSYLDYLNRAKSKGPLFLNDGKLRESCKWKGWNIKRMIQLFRYLLSRPVFKYYPDVPD